MPNHFYHPMLVHLPLVLPLCIGVLWYFYVSTVDDAVRSFCQRLITYSAGVLLVFSVLAFYSGQWVAEQIVEDFSDAELDTFQWHALFGRAFLWLSSAVMILSITLRVAKKHLVTFRLLLGFTVAALVLLSALSGYTGGELVHRFGVNSRLLHQE